MCVGESVCGGRVCVWMREFERERVCVGESVW